MSFNPFNGALVPFDYELTLLDREIDFMDLDTKCSNRTIQNYRYISPRGLGKSTLLEAYFSPEKCQELAKEGRKLVCICRFSGDEMRTDADVFVRLIEAVRDSLENLDADSQEYRMLSQQLEKLESEASDYACDPNKGEKLLMNMLNCLKRRRYYVTLVLDEFHQLACAKELADTTFSKMAAICQKGLISYIVASDYDDEVGSRSYYISPFSRIFTSDPTHLSGITSKAGRKAAADLIRSKITRFPQVVFTDEELESLLDITGGIPGLLKAALKDLFEIKQESEELLSAQELERYALSACTPLMEKWTQYFDDARWDTMEAVIELVQETAIAERLTQETDKKDELSHAGLIVKDLRRQEYHLLCPLFEAYIRRELSRRRRPPAVAQSHTLLDGLKAISGGGIHVHVEKYYESGASDASKNYHGSAADHSQNLTVENLQLNQGLSTSDVLQLLCGDGASAEQAADSRGLFAQQLSDQLRRLLPVDAAPLLLPDARTSPEAFHQRYDEEFDKLSQKLMKDVEVDEEEDLAVTPSELKTLEVRFAEARTRCRSELTDELLADQSQRCQFYIKLSVVVEDALNFPGIQMDDYSPQLVLYGKALEQSLRDNFYDLFHREPKLSVFSTYSQMEEPDSPHVFANKTVAQTLIGNYTYLISAQKAYLAGLCQEKGIRVKRQSKDLIEWTEWWQQLQWDIFDARGIRNLADHADAVSPDREKLDRMVSLLFGDDREMGILPRTLIGRALCRILFPASIPFAMIQSFVGSTCTLCDTVLKPNGGIKGIIRNTDFAVNISPKRVQAFCAAYGWEAEALADRELEVRILEYKSQDNREFFAAELLGVPALSGL